MTTIAGSRGQSSFADGTGAEARFSRPTSLAMDANDRDLYVIDSSNNAVRRLVRSASAPYTYTVDYTVDTIAAPPRVQLSTPTALAAFGGFVYVADTNNHVVRKIATTSPYTASVYAGSVGASGSADGVGTAARYLDGPLEAPLVTVWTTEVDVLGQLSPQSIGLARERHGGRGVGREVFAKL